ncbi:hypothetical protein DV515_00012368 [Chloebia gouldiae]|uniref:Uncharacterized protein n=1 Tax=Chloebia gouldiae TaxID=44316 RepID=A0A3L8S3T7_CHLGU|nr:hypothetical protein DV515_00012368 [Chloebia gouldiae]
MWDRRNEGGMKLHLFLLPSKNQNLVLVSRSHSTGARQELSVAAEAYCRIKKGSSSCKTAGASQR